MNRIPNWEEVRARGGRDNRLQLSNNEWESKVLALACEGKLLFHIRDIMTAGHDEGMRIKWDIGEGRDAKWNKAQYHHAKLTIWEFFHNDIVQMYQRRIAPKEISNIIRLRTGFILPASTMLNQLKDWNVPIFGRGGGPSIARDTRTTNGNNRATSQIPVLTTGSAGPSSPRQTPVSQGSLITENQRPGAMSASSSTQLDDVSDSLPQLEPIGPDIAWSTECLKQQMYEKDQKHHREIKTREENYERVLTKAKEFARKLDETKAELAKTKREKSHIQEDNKGLRAQVAMLQNANLNHKKPNLITQHIQYHGTKFENLPHATSSGFKMNDAQDLAYSLNIPTIEEHRRTLSDSGFSSGVRTNSKHLSVGSQNLHTNPKRPRHSILPQQMGRSASAQPQQWEQPSPSQPAMVQRPFTEPGNYDMQSVMGFYDEMAIGTVASVAAHEDSVQENFLNTSEDHIVTGALGGGWSEASPSNARVFDHLESFDGSYETSSVPLRSFIFGSSE